MAAYFIGVDGGTESLRVGIFDAHGQPHVYASSTYPTTFPEPSWAEQSPGDWWNALVDSIHKALAEGRKQGITPKDIQGMALDTTCCSVVMLDERGDALRPALIWMDVRASEEAAELAATSDPALAVNSAGAGSVSAEWLIPKAMWLKQHDAARYTRATWVCEYQDYLNFKLTGRMAASLNNASIRWHYNRQRNGGQGGYASSLLAAVDMTSLEAKLPSHVVPMGDVLGPLTQAAADALGLPVGLPIIQGGADAFVAMIGLGVVRPGALALITGSSHLHLGLSPSAFHGAGVWGTYPDAVVKGLHAIEGGQTSTGSVINWFRNLVGLDKDGYAELNAQAAKLPPGAEGLVVLEHFQGNRTPYTDPLSRGVLSGLTLKHGREHIFRAVIEGVAYGTELIFQTMRGAGYTPEHIVVCGGATNSPLWLQIHADVSGLPLTLTQVADAPALGSAILAAVGSGYFKDVPSACDAMVHTERTVTPNSDNHAVYQELMALYKATYPAMKNLLHKQATF